MKGILLSFTILISSAFTHSILAQNDFAEVGSYWLYSVEPHDGNGFGWEKIKVTKDTIVDGKNYKILQRTYYRQQTLPPLITQSGEYVFGLMNIENDSLFINDHFIFDYGAEAGDTLSVYGGFDYDHPIELLIDSIGTELVNGESYKKYYGNKLCPLDDELEFYQEFVALENIGAIAEDFFSWNIDGCILGGGTATFDCFVNGDTFNYPEGSDCIEPFLSSLQDEQFEYLKLYPNPVTDQLIITND